MFYSDSCVSGTYSPQPGGSYALVQREPVGVCVGVGAWNYPIQTCVWKVGRQGPQSHLTSLYLVAYFDNNLVRLGIYLTIRMQDGCFPRSLMWEDIPMLPICKLTATCPSHAMWIVGGLCGPVKTRAGIFCTPQWPSVTLSVGRRRRSWRAATRSCTSRRRWLPWRPWCSGRRWPPPECPRASTAWSRSVEPGEACVEVCPPVMQFSLYVGCFYVRTILLFLMTALEVGTIDRQIEL